jgi:hypothetical protein
MFAAATNVRRQAFDLLGVTLAASPHFSNWLGAPGLRIGKSSFARRAFAETEDLPDADRV